MLIGESRSFAGREARVDGDAIGRPMSVAFFEHVNNIAQGMVETCVCAVHAMMLCLRLDVWWAVVTDKHQLAHMCIVDVGWIHVQTVWPNSCA